jgi:hypothetical protein
MDLGEVGWGDVDWISLAQDRNRWRALVNSVLNLRVPWNAGKLSRGLTSSGLSSSTQLHIVSYWILKALCNSRTGVRLGKLPIVRFTFSKWVSAANSQAGQTLVITDLMSTLWRANLMWELNRSLSNREYVLINALKALASIVLMCSLHVILISNITPRYFTLYGCFVCLFRLQYLTVSAIWH